MVDLSPIGMIDGCLCFYLVYMPNVYFHSRLNGVQLLIMASKRIVKYPCVLLSIDRTSQLYEYQIILCHYVPKFVQYNYDK